MKKIILLPCLLVAAIYCTACGPTQVLRQDIPVSTNPMGADIYVDGQKTGVTPTTVSLERNKDHIVTLTKENYNQADVAVKRKYKETSLVGAINSGVKSGLFFNNAAMGVSNALGSMSEKEKSGEMFDLVPSTIQVTLTPLSGAGTGAGAPAISQVAPGSTQPSTSTSTMQPTDSGPELDNKTLVKTIVKVGAAAALTQMKPVEHKETLSSSSSSKTYMKPGGSVVTEKKSSKTSVSVGFNPAGAINLLDKLFK